MTHGPKVFFVFLVFSVGIWFGSAPIQAPGAIQRHTECLEIDVKMVSSSLSWHPNLHLPPTRRWPEIFIWEKHLLYGIPKKNNTHLDLVVADSPGRAVSPSPASAEFAVVAAPIHKRSSQQQFWLATLLSALKGPTSTNYQPWEILRVYFGILDVHKSMVPFECCSKPSMLPTVFPSPLYVWSESSPAGPRKGQKSTARWRVNTANLYQSLSF